MVCLNKLLEVFLLRKIVNLKSMKEDLITVSIICNYDILPTNYKHDVANDLEKNLYKLSDKKYIRDIKNHITTLRNETFDESVKKMYQKMFIKYNDAQDKFRTYTPTWRKLLPKLEASLIHK